MSDLLQAIRTVSISRDEQPALVERSIPRQQASPKPVSLVNDISDIQGPSDVLANLQNQPSEAAARRQLRWLLDNSSADLNIHIPSTRSISILRTFFKHTVPDLWSASPTTQGLICDCLTSLPGVRGLLAELSATSNGAGQAPAPQSNAASKPSSHIYLTVLEKIFSNTSLAYLVWKQHAFLSSDNQRKLMWKDFGAVLTSGKVVATVAKFQDDTASDAQSWLANGQNFTSHLGSWIFQMAALLSPDDLPGWEAATGLLSKGFGLGYSTMLVESICKRGIETQAGLGVSARLLQGLRPLDQKRLLDHLFFAIQTVVPRSETVGGSVSRISAFISALVKDNPTLRAETSTWSQRPLTLATISQPCRRAIVAVVSSSADDLATVLEGNMQAFSENLFIRHAPPLQQEACAEMILLCAGNLKRADPQRLKMLARSSFHMTGVSNRLNSSSQRSRALGMCVAMGISSLVDTGSAKMDFDVEDVKTPYAKGLMALADTIDYVGSAEDLVRPKEVTLKQSMKKPSILKDNSSVAKLTTRTKPAVVQTIGPRIVEVMSDEEDDLVAYDKPDSDPEDEDDDPTLINRDKVKAPVYIRDLMSGLKDDEKYDRLKLSLEQAAPLIRRKAQFGKELSDHAMELGTILIGLQDTFELERFVELRLQALIALLVSDPAELGPWFARQVFEGDYSLSQRGTILSAIGLGGRELAGLKDTDALNPPVIPKSALPSKRLPDKYHAIYAETPKSNLPSTPLNSISASLTDSIMAPLAASAADTATGPSTLKVRTFSSRLKTPARTKVIPNTLASQLADTLFTPLAGHFYTFTRPTSSDANNVFLAPFFLSTYLTTLAVLLHASGPATRSLPQLSQDLWALLLAARRGAADDQAVLRALLFGFLTLLDVNAEDTRRVATELGRELVETHAWVNEVYGRLPGGEEEADKLRGLAAGVLVKCGEVMEKWERLLVGDMMDY